eukprot:10795353-Karenia_brevis.AAC.1
MGCSFALWLCQELLEHISERAVGIDKDNRFIDRLAVPEGNSMHTEYVDNFVAFSRDPGQAEKLGRAVHTELQQAGLPVHDVVAGTGLT